MGGTDERAEGRNHPKGSCRPMRPLVATSGLLSIRIVHVCADSQTAEFLTADCADNADKGRMISDYPRHPARGGQSYYCAPGASMIRCHGWHEADSLNNDRGPAKFISCPLPGLRALCDLMFDSCRSPPFTLCRRQLP